MKKKEMTKVAIFRTGKEPKFKETIENVTSVSENEHCIIVDSVVLRKGKRPRPNRQIFSKPEFGYVREFIVTDGGEVLRE